MTMKIIRVIDFETTGLPSDPDGAAVCEVGYCDMTISHTGEITIDEPHAYYTNPGRPIPAMARAVHHISDQDVKDAIEEAYGLEGLHSSHMETPASIYCAHAADFEKSFFTPDEPWIDTWKVALRLWPDAPSFSNQALRYHLDLGLDRDKASPPHRAGPDSYVTAHLLMREIAEQRASIEDMIRWSAGPALFSRIMFGKHSGSRWQDVQSDYLEWIIDKSDLDKDVKANARHYLKLRH